MIYRKRSSPPPSYENSSLRMNQEVEIEKWRNSLIESTREGGRVKRARYSLALPIRHKGVPNFIPELLASFDHKCPFCETKLDADQAEVYFYRPPYGALQETNGQPDEHYYCWLIWQWSNIFPACEPCTNRKGVLFPVADERVNLGVRADHILKKERPLLIDPCNDDPDEHLEFHEDGAVTAKPGSKRGKKTIEFLSLNRESLQADRKAEVLILKQTWEEELQKASVPLVGVSEILQVVKETLLQAYCRDDQPFAGMKRQLLKQWSKTVRTDNISGGNIARDSNIQSTPVLPESVTIQPATDLSLLDNQRLIRDEYEDAVFVSYAWGGESESIVDQLEQAFTQSGIRMVRDKKDLEYKGSIETFEQRIGMGRGIVLVISDKYLRSEHCMYELIQLNKNRNLYSRIFPIVLADAHIYSVGDRLNYIKYWDEKIEELERAFKDSRTMTSMTGIYANLDKYGRIRSDFDEVINLLSDMNVLTPELHAANDFSILINKVERWMGGKE